MRADETAHENGAHFAPFLEDEGTGRKMVLWSHFTCFLDDDRFVGMRFHPGYPVGFV